MSRMSAELKRMARVKDLSDDVLFMSRRHIWQVFDVQRINAM